jgi:hypothetical protein
MIPEESSGWVPFQMAPVSRAICFRSPFETKRRVLGINLRGANRRLTKAGLAVHQQRSNYRPKG